MSNDCKCCGTVVVVGEEVTIPAGNCFVCEGVICAVCAQAFNDCCLCKRCGVIVCKDCSDEGFCSLCREEVIEV